MPGFKSIYIVINYNITVINFTNKKKTREKCNKKAKEFCETFSQKIFFLEICPPSVPLYEGIFTPFLFIKYGMVTPFILLKNFLEINFFIIILVFRNKMLKETRTNKYGLFELSVNLSQFFTITPYIRIFHKCHLNETKFGVGFFFLLKIQKIKQNLIIEIR